MAEIRHILCPVDLSEISRHALDHARAIAEWYDARLTVFHVISLPPPPLPSTGMAEDLAALPPPPEPREAAQEVRRFSGLAEAPAGGHADVVVVEGTPVKEILHQVEQLPADLLVMGTHGRSGFEALFLGAVTEKVLRSTYVPVLTVPPRVERPVEFSDPSTRALEYALTLAEETSARLILLHVVELLVDAPQFREISHFSVPEYQRHLEADARARLESAVPDEARVWCTPEERVASPRRSVSWTPHLPGGSPVASGRDEMMPVFGI